jgi:hypothetical protein
MSGRLTFAPDSFDNVTGRPSKKMGNSATNKFLTAIPLSHILLQRKLEFTNK